MRPADLLDSVKSLSWDEQWALLDDIHSKAESGMAVIDWASDSERFETAMNLSIARGIAMRMTESIKNVIWC